MEGWQSEGRRVDPPLTPLSPSCSLREGEIWGRPLAWHTHTSFMICIKIALSFFSGVRVFKFFTFTAAFKITLFYSVPLVRLETGGKRQRHAVQRVAVDDVPRIRVSTMG